MLKYLAALVVLALAVTPSAALDPSGSHGWSRSQLTLRTLPHQAGDVVGTVEQDLAIKVLRCEKLWCLVSTPVGKGWTSRDHIGFGQTSQDPLTGPNLNYASGGPGTICFYQGTNYSGASFCAGSGEVFPDLARWGLDNSFASVKVEGNVSAAACRSRDFQSYCERIVASQPVLDGLLRKNLTSIRVY
ncbi:peptidase inhibitor family I36 protein [Devosia sp. 63-57]|uniref:peptidase inhibitor family I36 protein n=1 Tax=Devosia sp. 63-57 TaxID=1895751 RepID=UPI00086F1914|nr:peptidase inhibitor family I36 protein [Devosia sp. 63-57]ODT50452.1 MAG: hypothetical protein ABS74_02725 [Pelagibacterium sp. SCN 63-126]ODU88532.1 MAG: hypothetical protein ABT14_02325 [Pelagibacterium sp. SCN 63-17]OJX45597.1 MAG: hypothetical protein BGO80_07320 [Devosia sp. 63-57]